MFKFSFALSILLLPVGSVFSDPVKSFPTPPGFTLDRNESWEMEYLVPKHISQLFGSNGTLKINFLQVCGDLIEQYKRNERRNRKNTTFEMGGVVYNFGAGQAGGSYKHNNTESQESIKCQFYWSKDRIISRQSPTYYIKKRN